MTPTCLVAYWKEPWPQDYVNEYGSSHHSLLSDVLVLIIFYNKWSLSLKIIKGYYNNTQVKKVTSV